MTKGVADDSADSIEPIVAHTAGIISAFVQHNSVQASDIPNLIRTIHSTLRSLEGSDGEPRNEIKPAVPVRKSVTPEFIVCLEDGKKLKMLKRYLRSRYGLSPEEYRLKWSLPADYPMVAPNYSSQRSAFAKKIGLGRSKPTTRAKRKGI
jgi:predicted transcriptional regulator